MANFDRSGMTQAGINLMGKAVGGATIQFTRLVLGDGTMTGEILDLQGVVSPKQNVDVTRIERNDNQCTVGGELLTKSVKQGFFWRECGLYAMDPDVGEILYNYAYSTKPDYIAESDSGMMEEILVSMVALVGANANVDVTIDSSMVFATKKEIIPLKNKIDDICISVKEFGAIGDGVTSDTNAIQNAINYALQQQATIFIPSGSYYIDSDLSFLGIFGLKLDGELKCSNENITITIGGVSNSPILGDFYIRKVIGGKLKVVGFHHGTITIDSVSNLVLYANSEIENYEFIAFSNFYLGYVEKMEFHCDGSEGWINDNLFIGGRIKNKLYMHSDSSHTPGNNIFIKTCIEGDACEINIESGKFNSFHDARLEAYPIIKFGTRTFGNTLEQKEFVESGGLNKWGLSPYWINSINVVNDEGIGNKIIKENFGKKDIDLKAINYYGGYNTELFTQELNDTLKPKAQYAMLVTSDIVKMPNRNFRIDLISDAAMWSCHIYLYDANKQPVQNNEIMKHMLDMGLVYYDNSNKRYVMGDDKKDLYVFFDNLQNNTVVKYFKLLITATSVINFNFANLTLSHYTSAKNLEYSDFMCIKNAFNKN